MYEEDSSHVSFQCPSVSKIVSSAFDTILCLMRKSLRGKKTNYFKLFAGLLNNACIMLGCISRITVSLQNWRLKIPTYLYVSCRRSLTIILWEMITLFLVLNRRYNKIFKRHFADVNCMQRKCKWALVLCAWRAKSQKGVMQLTVIWLATVGIQEENMNEIQC